MDLQKLFLAHMEWRGNGIPLTRAGLNFLANRLYGTTNGGLRAQLERELAQLQRDGLVVVDLRNGHSYVRPTQAILEAIRQSLPATTAPA